MLDSCWSHGRPAYRCRHGQTSARPRHGRMRNLYVREHRIIAIVRWRPPARPRRRHLRRRGQGRRGGPGGAAEPRQPAA
ncbi:hypothetical protein ACFPIJ_52315 [Dactylosporangium cerinum]|uniref:Uncharacterized protein n=1 Tax=Dactylosporangium cerinum TaxID=1434730 RepID=A0ABV9WH78_9ACTN